MSYLAEYRVPGWRIRQLDSLARRALSALAAAEEAEERLCAVCEHRRPAVFDQSYYEAEVERTRSALRYGARRLAEWSVIGAAAALPASVPANGWTTGTRAGGRALHVGGSPV